MKAPDLSHAQANLQAASTRAGAYLSSWGSSWGAWASEKKKGWGARSASASASTTPISSPPPTGDFKRAEQFRQDREIDGFVALTSAKTAPAGIAGEEEVGKKKEDRESVFFDAEKVDRSSKRNTADSMAGVETVAMTTEELLKVDAELSKSARGSNDEGKGTEKREAPEKETPKQSFQAAADVGDDDNPWKK